MTTQDYEIEEYGARVRRLRQERGLGQLPLAQACGIDPGFLSKIETGKRGTSSEVNAIIAKVLGVEATYLRDGLGQWTGILVDTSAPRGVRLVYVSAADSSEAVAKIAGHGLEVAYVIAGRHEAVHPCSG